MYFIPEPVNIYAKVSQNIRSHKNKEESWSFLLPKEPGMAVLDCPQALVSFVAKGTLGICEKKNSLFYPRLIILLWYWYGDVSWKHVSQSLLVKSFVLRKKISL